MVVSLAYCSYHCDYVSAPSAIYIPLAKSEMVGGGAIKKTRNTGECTHMQRPCSAKLLAHFVLSKCNMHVIFTQRWRLERI